MSYDLFCTLSILLPTVLMLVVTTVNAIASYKFWYIDHGGPGHGWRWVPNNECDCCCMWECECGVRQRVLMD